MLTKSETNNAVVVELKNVRPHPNADRLKLATVVGDQVVVSLDAKDGDVMVYFDSNLCLSPEYLSANNLYSNPELNVDKTKKGYFSSNGRVRAQKFRGAMSHGFVASLESVYALVLASNKDQKLVESFYVGNEFTHMDGVKICEKYIVPSTSSGISRSGSKTRKVKQPVSEIFWRHWDTKHLKRLWETIPAGQYLYVEEKIHGTSARTGNVLCRINNPWWKFWAPKEEWRVVSGTRRVDGVGSHMSQERKEIHEFLAPMLHKGEQLYYEIFGKTKSGKDVQDGFPYGCVGGKSRVMLYRVTITTPDGYCIDLPREKVYKRALELGLEVPPQLTKVYYAKQNSEQANAEEWTLNVEPAIQVHVEGRSTLDGNTLREGVVVWFLDSEHNWSCLKWKSDEFLLRESKQKDDGVGDVEDNL